MHLYVVIIMTKDKKEVYILDSKKNI